MEKSLRSTSKFLSLVLRHAPEKIGIELDGQGWTDVSELLDAANRHGTDLDADLLLQVVHENDKQRFAISEDGTKIRANQGHSVEVDLGYTAAIPPDVLFHGTISKFIPLIEEGGLKPMSRHHVHLSADTKTATIVAKRRGKPIILEINAKQMVADGMEFYQSANGVWLTDRVPPKFLTIPKT